MSLLKPQYEANDSERESGVVLPDFLEKVVSRVIDQLERSGCRVLNRVASVLPGAAGNREFFLLVRGRGLAARG